jgi:hypothetical protein
VRASVGASRNAPKNVGTQSQAVLALLAAIPVNAARGRSFAELLAHRLGPERAFGTLLRDTCYLGSKGVKGGVRDGMSVVEFVSRPFRRALRSITPLARRFWGRLRIWGQRT